MIGLILGQGLNTIKEGVYHKPLALLVVKPIKSVK
ncbi:hypothetical protein SAMN05443549_104340 [Flavobacterium fluvii]|uniref:Uncharacterized protein n=1 Tax=Flavobacterium fluvii TaxID=468056 RepID=A0A1M5KJT8_9FLAO|nr:hypothetical protein SAMN05443549_104340 [Flavobacterium fluvii]